MSYKFGALEERLVNAKVWFIPDGSNIGTELAPSLVSRAAAPADDKFPDYGIGRISICKYDPVTKKSTREWAATGGSYKQREDENTIADAFIVTMVDYATALFDRLAFGLSAAPVDGVSKQPFAKSRRHLDGWVLMKRTNDDDTVICRLKIHVRLTIATHPEDKNEPASPAWRIFHLADATDGTEEVVFRPEA